jgi:hypothetical protein
MVQSKQYATKKILLGQKALSIKSIRTFKFSPGPRQTNKLRKFLVQGPRDKIYWNSVLPFRMRKSVYFNAALHTIRK